MNDFIRPSLYQADHEILPCVESFKNGAAFDIVGPICETSDWLAKNKSFSIKKGDYIAILDVGAYCFSMSSNYNSRPRAIELLVDKQKALKVIRKRETLEELLLNEVQSI